jgi:hypothetical protein
MRSSPNAPFAARGAGTTRAVYRRGALQPASKASRSEQNQRSPRSALSLVRSYHWDPTACHQPHDGFADPESVAVGYSRKSQ